MNAEAKDLILEDGIGRALRDARSPREARALLTVAADGRSSPFREQAGLKMVRTSPPIDVLWFRPAARWRPRGYLRVRWRRALYGRHKPRRLLADCLRHQERQYQSVREAGLAAFRRSVGETIPSSPTVQSELQDWDAVKLLSVQADRLQRWHRPGLLCIGDAAHAMSPVGGIGINLAIADAVAAANILARPLRKGGYVRATWRQTGRELPT